MSLLASPDAALLVLLAGILLIYLEANRPGTILPGCLGALLALLSIHAISLQPQHSVSLLSIAAGVALTVGGIFRPTLNLLAVAGALAQAFGWMTLFAAPARLHPVTAVVFAAGFSFTTAWLGRMALLARRNKRVSGGRRSAPGLRKVD